MVRFEGRNQRPPLPRGTTEASPDPLGADLLDSGEAVLFHVPLTGALEQDVLKIILCSSSFNAVQDTLNFLVDVMDGRGEQEGSKFIWLSLNLTSSEFIVILQRKN